MSAAPPRSRHRVASGMSPAGYECFATKNEHQFCPVPANVNGRVPPRPKLGLGGTEIPLSPTERVIPIARSFYTNRPMLLDCRPGQRPVLQEKPIVQKHRAIGIIPKGRWYNGGCPHGTPSLGRRRAQGRARPARDPSAVPEPFPISDRAGSAERPARPEISPGWFRRQPRGARALPAPAARSRSRCISSPLGAYRISARWSPPRPGRP